MQPTCERFPGMAWETAEEKPWRQQATYPFPHPRQFINPQLISFPEPLQKVDFQQKTSRKICKSNASILVLNPNSKT